jgi:hypothetical protein
MAVHTLTLTAAEEKVITYYYGDPAAWVQSQVNGPLDRLMTAVILKKVRELLEANQPIPDTKAAIFALIDLTPVPFPQPIPF